MSLIFFLLCCLLFFFQAEDGIRDLVRSRGLGDVYKRQSITSVPFPKSPKFTPVSTISFTPFDAISSTFLMTFSMVSLLLLPLA